MRQCVFRLPFFQSDSLYDNTSSSPSLVSQPPPMEEAERFLQEIMPPG